MTEEKFPTGDPSPAVAPNGDAKARDEDTKFFPTEEDQNLSAYRGLRKDAFYWIGGVCLVYLIALLIILICLLATRSPLVLALLSNNPTPNWHPLIVMSVALVILATVPLSLGLGLLHMASEGRSESSEKNGVKIPSAVLLKVLMDAALKTGKG